MRPMAVVRNPARDAFARFIRRAIDQAKQERHWSITRIAEETGVGRSTLFRWLAGDWRDYPELEKVRTFCVALDIPVSAAFRALGLPGDTPVVTEMSAVDADIQTILVRLADPVVANEEKTIIRQMLRYLARGPLRRAG
jgi:transcriptional regulator with XRE-family HTH domain